MCKFKIKTTLWIILKDNHPLNKIREASTDKQSDGLISKVEVVEELIIGYMSKCFVEDFVCGLLENV